MNKMARAPRVYPVLDPQEFAESGGTVELLPGALEEAGGSLRNRDGSLAMLSGTLRRPRGVLSAASGALHGIPAGSASSPECWGSEEVSSTEPLERFGGG